MEERVKLFCKTFLSWDDPDKIFVKKLGKGCSNNILVATLKDGHTTRNVLVRMYGSIIRERVSQDVYINCYMDAIGKGPKILGLFEDGRLEEFIDSVPMTRERFSSDYETIIRLIANVHNMEMPLPRESTLEITLRKMSQLVVSENWKNEVKWYLDTLAGIAPNMETLKFCHNDFNMENLLIPRSRDNEQCKSRDSLQKEKLVLIDWEYAGYNFALYDIANYCCEMQYDWACLEPPYFLFKEEWLPDDEKLVRMLTLYKSLLFHPIETSNDILLRQLKFMMIGSELLWTMWALSLDQSFNIGMNEYFDVKMASYFKKKKRYDVDIKHLLDLSQIGYG